MAKRNFVDLFSGCGGLSLGLSLAGMKGVFAIERDEMAFETFSSNFLGEGSSESLRFDWPTWLNQKSWGIDEVLEKHKTKLRQLRGTIDILAGGPPCQGFSFAGRRLEDDPRNLLFNKYVEAVKLLQPTALILENVPGMKVAHQRGNVVEFISGRLPRQQSFYEKLAVSLDKSGYEVQSVLVDASRFGVPQRRKRLIAIGIRKELTKFLEGGVSRVFTLLEASRVKQLRVLQLNEFISASDAIGDLEIGDRQLAPCVDTQSPSGFSEATLREATTPYQKLMRKGAVGKPDSMRLARHRDDIRARFAQILSECQKGVHMSEKARSSFGLKKHRIHLMSPSAPAPTITTLPDDILHYCEPRILTVRESARIQSFPDWFQFKGKFTTGGDRRTRECPRYTQVGNAVPPLLAQAIGTAVSLALNEIERARTVVESRNRFVKIIAAE